MMYKRSQLTEQICDILRATNGEISWARLEDMTGKPLHELRPTISAARRYLDREDGIAFLSVRGVGLRRMADGDKVSDAVRLRRKVYKTAHQGSHRVGTISNFAQLSPAEQMKATLAATAFHAIREAAAERPQK